MANGDVHDQVSDQYLQQFDKSVGVSGMQKLQSFPQLQTLGHAGTLAHQKEDFHGLKDFKSQMAKYSQVSNTLRIAWALISFIVPNNPSIASKLTNVPGLGSVGKEFTSIHNFGQVFSLSPGDLKTPGAVKSKAAVYTQQSTKANVVETTSSSESIGGGGAGISQAGSASQLNGIQIVGLPTNTNNTLQFVDGKLIWQPVTGGGGGGGSGTLAGDTDVSFGTLINNQFLQYNSSSGKWVNHTLAAGDIPNITESQVTGLVSDLATLGSAIISEAATRSSADSTEAAARAAADALLQPLSGKDAASGYAGLTAGGLLKTAEFPIPTTTTFGGVKDKAAVAHNFVTSIVNGIPILAQPDYSDITSTPQLAQTKTAVTSNWLRSYDATTGLYTASQPAFTDISGTASTAQIPNLDASKITTGQIALARGGTEVDLSATGGTTKILAQDASHVVSARDLVIGDIPSLSTLYLPLATGGSVTGDVAITGQISVTKRAYSGQLTVASTATPTFNLANADSFLFVLTSNVTAITFSNLVAGQKITLVLQQDGTGGWTWNWAGANVTVNNAPAINSISGNYTILTFTTDGSQLYTESTTSSTGGSLAGRTTATASGGSLNTMASSANVTGSITLAKSFLLQKLVANFPARVRLYSTAAFRDADVSRPNSIPPTPGTQHGVIADLYLTNDTGLTWKLSPPCEGCNDDTSASTSIYYSITNLDTVTRSLSIVFTYLAQES